MIPALGSQQPGRFAPSDARQGKGDRSGLFLTVFLHCAFKLLPGRARQMLLCPLTSGRGGGRRVPPFPRPLFDDKTFLGNLREDTTPGSQGTDGSCQRRPLPSALLNFLRFQIKREYARFQAGHLLPQLYLSADL